MVATAVDSWQLRHGDAAERPHPHGETPRNDSASSSDSWEKLDYSWRQDDEWKTDLTLCIAKMKTNGLYLATASKEMQAQKRVVIAAVTENGHAMAVCSTELKNDEDIVFAAVEQDGDALAHAGESLRNRKDVLEAEQVDILELSAVKVTVLWRRAAHGAGNRSHVRALHQRRVHREAELLLELAHRRIERAILAADVTSTRDIPAAGKRLAPSRLEPFALVRWR